MKGHYRVKIISTWKLTKLHNDLEGWIKDLIKDFLTFDSFANTRIYTSPGWLSEILLQRHKLTEIEMNINNIAVPVSAIPAAAAAAGGCGSEHPSNRSESSESERKVAGNEYYKTDW